jgi:hypothetical protein
MRIFITIFFSLIYLNSFSQEKTIRIQKSKIEDGTYLSDVFHYSYRTTRGKAKNIKIQLKCIVFKDSIYIYQNNTEICLKMIYKDSLAIGQSSLCDCTNNIDSTLISSKISSNSIGQLIISELPFWYKSSKTIIKPKKLTFLKETNCVVDKGKFLFTKISD